MSPLLFGFGDDLDRHHRHLPRREMPGAAIGSDIEADRVAARIRALVACHDPGLRTSPPRWKTKRLQRCLRAGGGNDLRIDRRCQGTGFAPEIEREYGLAERM